MSAGPGLMFVSLPKVFFSMGFAGRLIGIVFFVLAGFAALTSCISVLESITANCMELFHAKRKITTKVLSVIYLIATAVIALGYSIFYVEVKLPNGKMCIRDSGNTGLLKIRTEKIIKNQGKRKSPAKKMQDSFLA